MNGPAPTVERFWLTYIAAVLAICLFTADGGRSPAARAWFVGVHLVVLCIALLVACVARRDHRSARWWRAAMAIGGLPVVFSALCWMLPHVHPEPFEYRFLQLDRLLYGGDAAQVMDGLLMPWVLEPLQVIYALFYIVPVIAALGARRRSGGAAFDRSVAIIVGAFLVSYLGYLLVPTLAPKVVLTFDRELHGSSLFATLRASIDEGESNPWNCFPSGHTMLTLVSLLIAWRWHRSMFWWLLVPGLLLIASTVLLRYHWTVDVFAGAALVWPTVRVVDCLLDRDGWPPVPELPPRDLGAQRVAG